MSAPDPADSTRRIAESWRELRRGAHETALRSHLLGPDGPILEQAQLDALEILASESNGWRMSEFADAMRVDPSVATRAVDRLQRMGLAERSKSSDDGRIVTASITPAGARTVRRVTRRRAAGMERLLDGFTPAERSEFADQLERFVASINRLSAELAAEAAERRRRR